MIAVLTYNAPHRKTQDLIMRLVASGHKDVRVVATPWEDRKNFVPLVPHRPGEPGWPCPPLDLAPGDLCANVGYPFEVVDKYGLCEWVKQNADVEMVLVGGAGILPPEFVESIMVVNSHPAFLPYARGLDALKWAIYSGNPVGVTLHIIDRHPDAGIIVKQEMVPLYHWDTFHSFAMRQYEMEMDLLARAQSLVAERLFGSELKAQITRSTRVLPDAAAYEVHRRMPHLKETIMLRRFERMREDSE